ncbi:MAG: DNA polymerase III subunit [Chloroflexi bacterium]|nr:DNA polymerase III subunit [Chloroflexota bacterium]
MLSAAPSGIFGQALHKVKAPLGLDGEKAMIRTIGHTRAVNALRRGLESDRVSHAYLFAGPAHVGKMTLAIDLARMVNCIGDDRPCGECRQCVRISQGLHTDVRVLGLASGDAEKEGAPSRTAISIDEIRTLGKEANLKPFEGRSRVFIIEDAERMSEAAANALLKTLEEPPEQVLLVLLTSKASLLPPTVVSRCQQLELRPLPALQVAEHIRSINGLDAAQVEEIARVSAGRLGWALRAVEQPETLDSRYSRLQEIWEVLSATLERRFSYAADLAGQFANDRDSVVEELGLWLSWFRDVMLLSHEAGELVVNLSAIEPLRAAAGSLSGSEIAGAVRAIDKTLELLKRNVSPRLALEQLMLRLPRPGP